MMRLLKICTLLVMNNSLGSFPFTVGWHPYFYSKSLLKSCIQFNEKILPNKILKKSIKLKDKKFDDCYSLADNLILFKTPDYKMFLTSNSKKLFLQIYTPTHRNSIAIEPQTGISNSFNTKEGLQVLKPKEKYSINWKIQIT